VKVTARAVIEQVAYAKAESVTSCLQGGRSPPSHASFWCALLGLLKDEGSPSWDGRIGLAAEVLRLLLFHKEQTMKQLLKFIKLMRNSVTSWEDATDAGPWLHHKELACLGQFTLVSTSTYFLP